MKFFLITFLLPSICFAFSEFIQSKTEVCQKIDNDFKIAKANEKKGWDVYNTNKSSYDSAYDNYSNATENYNEKSSVFAKVKTAFERADNIFKNSKNDYENKLAYFQSISNNYGKEEVVYKQANSAYIFSKDNFQKAEKTYNKIQQAYKKAKTDYDHSSFAYQVKLSTYKSAIKSYAIPYNDIPTAYIDISKAFNDALKFKCLRQSDACSESVKDLITAYTDKRLAFFSIDRVYSANALTSKASKIKADWNKAYSNIKKYCRKKI